MEIWWLIYILISPQAQIERIEYVLTEHSKTKCMEEMKIGLKHTREGEWLACVPGKGLWV